MGGFIKGKGCISRMFLPIKIWQLSSFWGWNVLEKETVGLNLFKLVFLFPLLFRPGCFQSLLFIYLLNNFVPFV